MPPCGAAFFILLSALAPAGYARPGWGRCISLFTFGVPSQPTPRACPVGFGVPQIRPKRRRWRYFHHFPRRDPHPVNSTARGPASPQPVGVGVLDDPFLRPLPAPRRRAGCGRRGPPAKGEPPARVPPLTPSCASLSMGAFRALRRASMGSAPGPRPLFCKKAGQKTFRRQSTSDPNPSPLGRVMK